MSEAGRGPGKEASGCAGSRGLSTVVHAVGGTG